MVSPSFVDESEEGLITLCVCVNRSELRHEEELEKKRLEEEAAKKKKDEERRLKIERGLISESDDEEEGMCQP